MNEDEHEYNVSATLIRKEEHVRPLFDISCLITTITHNNASSLSISQKVVGYRVHAYINI